MKIDTKEVEKSVLKVVVSTIATPFLAPLISEMMDYRGKVKQNRLNRFTELLEEYLKGEVIDKELMKSEDFSDLFESVLRRVTQTNAEEKLQRFRDIVVKNIPLSTSSQLAGLEYTDMFLDIISTLSEIDIRVLKGHAQFNDEYLKMRSDINEFRSGLPTLESELVKEKAAFDRGHANNYEALLQDKIRIENMITASKNKEKGLAGCRTPEYYGISRTDFSFSKQILVSKGLLLDIGVGSIGIGPLELMGISLMGEKFLKFIEF